MFIYLMMSAIKAEIAKRIARIIVALKIVFSKPLLVWCPELKLSPMPPPSPEAVRCSKMPTDRSTAKITCM